MMILGSVLLHLSKGCVYKSLRMCQSWNISPVYEGIPLSPFRDNIQIIQIPTLSWQACQLFHCSSPSCDWSSRVELLCFWRQGDLKIVSGPIATLSLTCWISELLERPGCQYLCWQEVIWATVLHQPTASVGKVVVASIPRCTDIVTLDLPLNNPNNEVFACAHTKSES